MKKGKEEMAIHVKHTHGYSLGLILISTLQKPTRKHIHTIIQQDDRTFIKMHQ